MKDEFINFQLEEYKNISSAHFETNKQIAIFFRYYLLIASAPAIILMLLEKNIEKLDLLFIGELGVYETTFIGFILLIISFIGFFTCLYITSLISDSTLYAKTVNGTRRFFYDLSKIEFEERFRVLPKVTCEPTKSNQNKTSRPILVCISVINSIYFCLGTYIIGLVGNEFFKETLGFKHLLFTDYSLIHVLILFFLILLIHWYFSRRITNFKNYGYLKSYIIGIDIDGVLNKHRRTFCTILYENTGKTLWENEITRVPVSLIPDKQINRTDEFKVFNDPNYWKNQEIFDEKTSDIITELRNSFGYKINIFSFRPWPDYKYIKEEERLEIFRKWWKFKIFHKEIALPFSKTLFNLRIHATKIRYRRIKSLTKDWLNKVEINYDKLIIETNGVDNPPSKNISKIPKLYFRNRYYHAQKQHFRYFIEDIVENAVKLSFSCDYVFLIEQPYNSKDNYRDLPNNIIRVKDWSAIKEKIRELG